MANPIKVLIADDSALMRKTLKEIFATDSRFVVTGTARDGMDLLDKARELRPDVITLDINMPRLDGISALKEVVAESIAPVIMVSSLTQKGADITLAALEIGAFDFVAKPGGTVSVDMSTVAAELLQKSVAAVHSGTAAKLARRTGGATRPRVSAATAKKGPPPRLAAPPGDLPFKAVAIGISTGGPKTIFEVLPHLPANLGAAIFLVQHIPPNFTASYATRIDKACALRCVEAQSGMTVEPGTIYLGQGGRHLHVLRRNAGAITIRTPNRPEAKFMPSVNEMMHSVVATFGAATIGVIMTGMGDDGALAMEAVYQAGGITIAESEESAVVWGMPGAAVARGIVMVEKPCWEIAAAITAAVLADSSKSR